LAGSLLNAPAEKKKPKGGKFGPGGAGDDTIAGNSGPTFSGRENRLAGFFFPRGKNSPSTPKNQKTGPGSRYSLFVRHAPVGTLPPFRPLLLPRPLCISQTPSQPGKTRLPNIRPARILFPAARMKGTAAKQISAKGAKVPGRGFARFSPQPTPPEDDMPGFVSSDPGILLTPGPSTRLFFFLKTVFSWKEADPAAFFLRVFEGQLVNWTFGRPERKACN